jgi:hypothetical protein
MPYQPKMGEVCIFENEKMGRDTAPDHQGYIIAHRDIRAGEKIAIALWSGKAHSARSFNGRIDDLPAGRERLVEPNKDLFGRSPETSDRAPTKKN